MAENTQFAAMTNGGVTSGCEGGAAISHFAFKTMLILFYL